MMTACLSSCAYLDQTIPSLQRPDDYSGGLGRLRMYLPSMFYEMTYRWDWMIDSFSEMPSYVFVAN